MIRRSFLSLLLFAGLLIGAAAPRPTRAATLTPVSFALNWLTNVEFAGIWVAQQKGWWTDAGLSVTARPYDFNTDPEVLVGAGKYTFGFQDGASVIIARGKGVPVKAVWASLQQSPFAFITMPKSGIKTVKDFRGKRIGYQAHQLYVLEAMLNHEGMTLKDVHPVVVQFDPTVLLAGKVDAYLAFINNEPIALKLGKGLTTNIIPASAYGYDFYSDVLFTTDSELKSNPALVRKVVAVMQKGWLYAIAHPAETAKIVVPKLDKDDSVAQQTAEMAAMAKLSTQGGAVGSMTTQRWQNGIDLLSKYKQITTHLKPSDLFTTVM